MGPYSAGMQLMPAQVRVFGCLLEKEMTVPDTYPMTLNSLVTACNQQTSRSPVVSYPASEVSAALDRLRTEHRLVRVLFSGAGSRVDKFRHIAEERLGLSRPEKAVLCVLALRGPQTLSEIKARTERMHDFADVDGIERVLDRLCDPTLDADPDEPSDVRDSGMLRAAANGPELPAGHRRPWDGPLVVRFDRQAGQKEARVMHLLGGPVDASAWRDDDAAGRGHTPSGSGAAGLADRVTQLEAELAALRTEFDSFREQFS